MTTVRGPHAFRNHAIFILAVLAGTPLLLLFALALYMSWPVQRQDGQPPAGAPIFIGPPSNLPAPYGDLLKDSGWLPYISETVNTVELFDYEAFASAQGPILGQAMYGPDRRVQVAVRGRSAAQVVGNIVEAAAKLNGFAQTGWFANDQEALRVEQRFLRDARRLERRRRHERQAGE